CDSAERVAQGLEPLAFERERAKVHERLLAELEQREPLVMQVGNPAGRELVEHDLPAAALGEVQKALERGALLALRNDGVAEDDVIVIGGAVEKKATVSEPPH